MLETFDGAVVVVTGGASGIGRGIALESARRGAKVAIADVHAERMAATAAELEALGGEVLAVRCDVTSDADVDALRDAVIERFGHVDLLCNNAGVPVLGPVERVDMADWQWILDVNVLGIVRGVRSFVPAMLERGTGHVLNTASVAGIWAYSWDAAPYITSKFAAYGLSEAMARRLHPHGVGVSVLCPGLVTTNLGENVRVSGVPAEQAGDWVWFPPEMLDPVEADDVGPLVADAVLGGRFAIFTHANDEVIYKEWRRDIDASLARAVRDNPASPVIPPGA
jgi:NAD(P)-dependent dehydrogenase (short-subunit alcohol dehydrogenase family)